MDCMSTPISKKKYQGIVVDTSSSQATENKDTKEIMLRWRIMDGCPLL
jgi:hypothetical protein